MGTCSVPGADQQTRDSHGAFLLFALEFSPGWGQPFPGHYLLLPQSSSFASGLGGKCSPASSCSSLSLFHFPSKFTPARESKTIWGNNREITCSSHLQSGLSSPKPEPVKSFPLLLGLLAHVLYSFTNTNKPSRNNFNWTWTIVLPSANTPQVKSELRRRSWGSKTWLEVEKWSNCLV